VRECILEVIGVHVSDAWKERRHWRESSIDDEIDRDARRFFFEPAQQWNSLRQIAHPRDVEYQDLLRTMRHREGSLQLCDRK
jgi:hypothetical protein